MICQDLMERDRKGWGRLPDAARATARWCSLSRAGHPTDMQGCRAPRCARELRSLVPHSEPALPVGCGRWGGLGAGLAVGDAAARAEGEAAGLPNGERCIFVSDHAMVQGGE